MAQAFSSLPFVTVWTEITRSINDGLSPSLYYWKVLATGTQTAGLLANLNNGSVQPWLAMDEYLFQTVPRAMRSAGVVGGKLHKVI